jgi:redox-sensitive bicupin YhaK (pirin superfamily)
VYCYDGAISINGTLTLNGAGLYIIRTPGALNTAASSQVVLASGASADKLFFVPAGASTIGANSVLRGTLLSSAGAITVGDNTTVQRGRVLTGAAVTLQNNQIAVP